MKKKILYLSDSSLDKPGGAQQSMKALIDEINIKSNFEIYIISPKGTPINSKNIVLQKHTDFVLKNNNFLENCIIVYQIYKKIKEINPKIIHVQMTSTMIIINILKKLNLIKNKIKIVYTDRGVYGKYGWLTTISINSIIKESTRFITTTNNNKKNYEKHFKKYSHFENKFQVIYNTAGSKYDKFEYIERVNKRKKLGIKDSDFVIGFCGRFSKQKNWSLAKRIIQLSKGLNNTKYVLVIGSDGSEDNIAKIKSYIAEIESVVGKSNVISFIDIDNDTVSEMYYAMDCFVLTSRWESFGRTAVEAMARKSLVIGTNVDGLSEVIGDENFLFSNEADAFQIICENYYNNQILNQNKEKFYRLYHKHFSSKANVKQYQNLYTAIFRKYIN